MSGRSVLGQIEDEGREVPRLRLREESADDVAVGEIETGKLRGTGRYDVIGEIARGGVGHVLKARDIDIGRDVALKVMREDHGGNRELVKRLVEEAQVGGQLQTSGIVPVYELGVAGGGRPYFAMKLVKGETLAALLAARSTSTDDRRRLLVIFEQVLATMAYAHSRGVVHRDLKPSNIMIGAFGEVLVVDWGFVKVLPQGGIADERLARQERKEITMIATMRSSEEGSESIVGSVMGTPAYMPPEQALGQVEALDERSDVFALGAILTELLTGKPPYVGDQEDQLVMAAQARLDDAFARLDACGADPELVALAKSCLSSLRRERPRDAGVLHERVGAHLADVAERARRSQVAALEAKEEAARTRAETAEIRANAEAERAKAEAQRAKAEEARRRAEEARVAREELRRRRRQTVGIAAALLLAIVVGVGGWAFIDSGRQSRLRRVAGEVEEKLREATGLGDAGRHDDAIAAAEQALEMADAGGAPAELTARAGKAVTAAKREKAERRRDEAMVVRLETAFLGAASGYAAAFREYGIDLDASSAADAGREIARRRIATELVAALDDWAMRDGVRSEKLLATAGAVDADPIRKRVREAFGDGDALRGVAEEDLEGRPARTFELLASALAQAGEPNAAIDVLERGWAAHPGDFRIHVRLGRALKEGEFPGWERVACHLGAAYALRPERTDLRTAREEAIDQAYAPLMEAGGLLAEDFEFR